MSRASHPPENARTDLRLSALALRGAEDNQPRPVDSNPRRVHFAGGWE